MEHDLTEVIESFRRLRVRQGDFDGLFEFLVHRLDKVAGKGGPAARVARTAKSRALELKRVGPSLPKFVVEDLLDECIAQLEAARR
jgi:hypothetical protein